MHGSASLGAGLVVLRGVIVLWERRDRLRRVPRAWARPLGLIAGAPLCLLVNPYGPAIVHYYRATLFNHAFRALVPESGPVTSSPIVATLFFLTSAIIVWSFGRYRSQTTLWERAAMLLLAAGAILAVRNIVWSNLATVVVLPLSIDGAVRARGRRRRSHPRLNVAILAVGTLALVIAAAASASRSRPSATTRRPVSRRSAARWRPTPRCACTPTSATPTGCCGGYRRCEGGSPTTPASSC